MPEHAPRFLEAVRRTDGDIRVDGSRLQRLDGAGLTALTGRGAPSVPGTRAGARRRLGATRGAAPPPRPRREILRLFAQPVAAPAATHADEPHDALSPGREDGRGGSPCSSWVCAAHAYAPTARHHRRKTLADGFEILSEDHREVERLFDTYRHDPEDWIAYDICGRLGVHTRIEEAALYPALRRYVDGGDDLADVAEQEHAAAKSIIARIYDSPPGQLFDLVTELRSEVEHHVESEESDLFPEIRESGVDAGVLGAEIAGARRIAEAERRPHPERVSWRAVAWSMPPRRRCRAGALPAGRGARVRRSSALRRARGGGVVDQTFAQLAGSERRRAPWGGCRRCGRPWECSRGPARPRTPRL